MCKLDLSGVDLIIHAKDCNVCTERIINDNLPLVYAIQTKYSIDRQYDRDEFAQEGRIALYDCIRMFDPNRGVKFSTMAFNYIGYAFKNLINHRKRKQRYFYQHDCEDLLDLMPVHADPSRNIQTQDRADHLLELMSRLHPREMDILKQRHGIAPYSRPSSLQEIAVRLNLSKERVRQLESRGQSQLKKLLNDTDASYVPFQVCKGQR